MAGCNLLSRTIMAESDSEPAVKTSGSPWPKVMLLVAGITAAFGAASVYSIWSKNKPPDGPGQLRLAMQEYLEGRPGVAGKLAENVVLPGDGEEEIEVEVDEEEEDEEPILTPEELEAIEKAAAEQQRLLSLRSFLSGAGKIAHAEMAGDAGERRTMLKEAVEQLQDAAAKGFPPGRGAEGYRLLGESQFELGKFGGAADALEEALKRDQTPRRELMPLLAEASRQRTDQNGLQRGLETIENYLQLPSLSPTQARHGHMILAEILSDLERWPEVESLVNEELATIGEADLAVQASWAGFRDELRLLDAGREIAIILKRYGAEDGWKPQLTEDGSPDPRDRRRRLTVARELRPAMSKLAQLHREAEPKIAAQARLMSAHAYRGQGDLEQAISQFTAVRQQRPFGAAGLLAGIGEIELLASQGRGQEVLQTTRYLIRELGTPSQFDARLISMDEFRNRMLRSIETLRDRADYSHAIDVARSLSPLFSLGESMRQEGQGFRRWAAATLEDGREASGTTSRQTARLARSRYRAAGEAFEKAAELQFNEPEYLDLLWDSIDAYQKGRHFSRSIVLLEPYLRYEARRKQPRGLLAYARALLAVGEPQRAIEALETCIIEFERDSLRYDARLMAALASLELANRITPTETDQATTPFQNAAAGAVINTVSNVNPDIDSRTQKDYIDLAKAFLRANLDDGDLTPKSETWRDSLFTLSELLYEQIAEVQLKSMRLPEAERLVMIRENESILDEGIRWLDQVDLRGWTGRRAEISAYYLARSHAWAAEWAKIKSREPNQLDAARRMLRQESERELNAALDGYRRLRRKYEDYAEEHPLDANEDMILRNCLFYEADSLHKFERLEEAATAYRAISLRYINEPSALEAIIGQAKCVRAMQRISEADNLLRQAAAVLEKIPPELDDQFIAMTRFDRAGWERYLGWING
ncbi:MAG: hypothetical protein AAF989_00780 [Planctomycetota bacterium]